MPPSYIELHARSAFSFLRGASLPEELAAQAAALGYAALALTDLDNLCGAPRFHRAMQAAGLRPLVGAEATIDGEPLLLLCRDATGYGHLCRLLTRAAAGGASFQDLTEHSTGLVCLLPALRGPLRTPLARGDHEAAAVLHRRLAEIDPLAASRIDPGNARRIVRALEVAESTGRTLSSWQQVPGTPILQERATLRFVITPERERLMATIDRVKNGMNPSLEVEGIVLTMFDPRNNLAHQVAEEVRKHFFVFDSIIPRNVRLSEAPSHGKPVLLYDAQSKGAQGYLSLARELLQGEPARAAAGDAP